MKVVCSKHNRAVIILANRGFNFILMLNNGLGQMCQQR